MIWIMSFIAFVSIGAAIVWCALKANKIQPTWTSTDEDKIIDDFEREKKANLLSKGGTIK